MRNTLVRTEVAVEAGLKISVVEVDSEYLGIDVCVWNARFGGTAFIYAQHGQLKEFASVIAGFPSQAGDERTYEFGTRDPQYVSGYCKLHFRSGSPGIAAIDVGLCDDGARSSGVASGFTVPVEAAQVDRFVQSLRHLEVARTGSAVLGASD
jgi:hypothetical protein